MRMRTVALILALTTQISGTGCSITFVSGVPRGSFTAAAEASPASPTVQHFAE